jgi:DNA (cytosine-5)-methyltransferase 1
VNVLDLFSGIGGMSLGLERAGMKTAAFCEIEPYCQKILAKHWPNVPLFQDVTNLSKKDLDARGITVDLLCGGFPCQDISVAGKQVGLGGERSGLFFEILRIVREYREAGERIPWLLIENVPNLRLHGIDTVISSLESEGYACWPTVVGAWTVGAPHKRDRAWIVAHAASKRLEGTEFEKSGKRQWARYGSSCGWNTEPGICRVANGIPDRMERLKSLGNAVVPAIPELIGRWIMQTEAANG